MENLARPGGGATGFMISGYGLRLEVAWTIFRQIEPKRQAAPPSSALPVNPAAMGSSEAFRPWRRPPSKCSAFNAGNSAESSKAYLRPIAKNGNAGVVVTPSLPCRNLSCIASPRGRLAATLQPYDVQRRRLSMAKSHDQIRAQPARSTRSQGSEKPRLSFRPTSDSNTTWSAAMKTAIVLALSPGKQLISRADGDRMGGAVAMRGARSGDEPGIRKPHQVVRGAGAPSRLGERSLAGHGSGRSPSSPRQDDDGNGWHRIPFSRIREIKRFPLRRRANHWHWSAHPGPPEGRIMIVTIRWAGMRWTLWRQAGSARRTKRRSVRRSRVVLAPRPWRLSVPASAGTATVTKNAAHRGEHEANRKTIARGKPV